MTLTPRDRNDFFVHSDSGETYYVDLEHYGGNGKCDCMDFRCRLEPFLDVTFKPTRKLECKHIRFVKQALSEAINRYQYEIANKKTLAISHMAKAMQLLSWNLRKENTGLFLQTNHHTWNLPAML